MGDKVILVMDRESVELIERLTAGALIGSPTRQVNEPFRAALDRDPDALVEQVGLAMEDWACRMYGILASSHRPGRDDGGREAQKVLAAITGEGKEA